jgi:nitroreductase
MSRELFDVVGRQRAHREFSDAPVDDSVVIQLLRAATFAPSAENRQPWEFVVVREPAGCRAIAEVARQAWLGGARDMEKDRLPPALFADVDRGMTGGFSTAPVWIVVCADNERGLSVSAPASIFPAVQNLLLAATALDLASALTTLAAAFEAELRELLGLPDHVAPMAAIPIGHPVQPLGPPRREPAEQHTHRERYGAPW